MPTVKMGTDDHVASAWATKAAATRTVRAGLALEIRRGQDRVLHLDVSVGSMRTLLIIDVALAAHYYALPTLEKGYAAFKRVVASQRRQDVTAALTAAPVAALAAAPSGGSAALEDGSANLKTSKVVMAAVDAAERHAAQMAQTGDVALNLVVGNVELALVRDCAKVRLREPRVDGARNGRPRGGGARRWRRPGGARTCATV